MFNVSIITTPFIFQITVNCYLVKTEDRFMLIDSATTSRRAVIENALNSAGCQPGHLKLIVLTHGDFDHCGNAAHLRSKFGAPVTMHEADTGMVEEGDMFWNRKPPNPVMKRLTRLLFRLSKAAQFKPDFYIREGDTLSKYGFNAEVIELPGHSKGSVGLLMPDGSLFCGDLLANTGKPAVWSIIDDHHATRASVEKLRGKSIGMVYPGHGQPFPIQTFWKHYDAAGH